MSLKEKIIAVVFLGMLASSGLVIAMRPSVGTKLGGLSDTAGRFSDIGVTGTSTAKIVGVTSAQVMATSSAREYARISNLAGFAIYCNANADKAAVGFSGIMIAASSTLEIDRGLSYTGAVQCISPQGNASTTVYSGR